MGENKGISRLSANGAEDVARMSQRLVYASFSDFDGRNVAVARVQQNDAQNLLVEKLHIGAGSIN